VSQSQLADGTREKVEGTSTLIECEHVFVTSHGSAYSQFKRALERRNFLLAWTLAAELPKVPLADALSLLLLALDQQPWRFERAAPRWHARLCADARLTLSEAQLALAALEALGGQGAVGGGQALVAICNVHGLDDVVGVLDAWLEVHD
jgi:hypothetical protein